MKFVDLFIEAINVGCADDEISIRSRRELTRREQNIAFADPRSRERNQKSTFELAKYPVAECTICTPRNGEQHIVYAWREESVRVRTPLSPRLDNYLVG